jgi:transposase
MAIPLPDARELSDEVLHALRLRALRGCELGFSETAVADLLGVSRETVCRWWSAYVAGGLEALPAERSGRPVGSGRTLTEAQARHLRHLIDTHSPEEVGLAAPLWNRRAVRALILKECGVDMPVRTVGAYLQRWGYTAKKPRRHARKQDPEEVRRWLEQTYPAITQRAKAEGTQIHWCDETGVAADAHPGYGYAREGQRATLEVPDPHIRVNLIAAISPEGTVRFMTYRGTLNAAVFLAFLGRLVRTTGRKIFVIVDHLRAHETDAVAAWVAAHKDRIEVFYLPRRAPELNPEEYLNQDLKGDVHGAGLPANVEELDARIRGFMRTLLHLPLHVMSYFKHPCVRYAASP